MNQDNFVCNGEMLLHPEVKTELEGQIPAFEHPVFAVFDGMGGEEKGEVASFLASKEALQLDVKTDPVESMRQFCKRANDQICEFASANNVYAMGTTMAMLAFSRKKVTLCNIGDSKIFRIGKKEIAQISKDHIVESAEYAKPPLSQNLGIPPEELQLKPYFSVGSCRSGDTYLICSDGLTDMVPVDEIRSIVSKNDVQAAGQALYALAMKNGGRDNITIILCRLKRVLFGKLRWKWAQKKKAKIERLSSGEIDLTDSSADKICGAQESEKGKSKSQKLTESSKETERT